MLPLFSARTRRISKISSCLRMPVAPAISSSLAILVSAEMLISFIADSEMLWAGAAGGAWGAGAGAADAFSAGWVFSAGWFLSGGFAVATPPFGLGALRSSSTVRPVLRLYSPRPAAQDHQTTFRIHARDACALPATACLPWFR